MLERERLSKTELVPLMCANALTIRGHPLIHFKDATPEAQN